MLHSPKNIRASVILISTWTIIEHSYYDVVFVYLTYFFKQSCGPIHLKNETSFLNRSVSAARFRFTEPLASDDLYNFLREVLQKANLPSESNAVKRTELYLVVFFFADMLWLLTAFGLAAGACCRIKKKFLSIFFYGPWLLCSAFVNFLDVVSSVQYGLDLIYIRSYTSWLRFVGVRNYTAFVHYDALPSSKMAPIVPTAVVVILLSRVFFVWLLNVICFFVILFVAIPDMAPQSIRPHSRRALTTRRSRSIIDPNSSEARIRNWQLFYGAIEANSTMTTPIKSSINTKHSRKSSVSFNKELSGGAYSRDDSYLSFNENSSDNVKMAPELQFNDDGGFRRFSDVTSGVSLVPSPQETRNELVQLPSAIKGFMPWSYLCPEGSAPKLLTEFKEAGDNKTESMQCTKL
ncbi:uncharacterized protein [Euwallacea similis]|uniref:uncharacterized protein isoform X2 n=1 Tax=Euwallacea similis TaxID=1736056 RepID=UPI003450E21C